MSRIRITKEFNFEMAHALHNYDGLCKNIHGHSYKLYVTIFGEPIDEKNNPKNGMVMDFGQLKKIVNQEIVKPLDHALVIFEQDDRIEEMKKIFDNVLPTPYQPTCENLVAEFAEKINKKLSDDLKVYSIRLYETATSYAEWFASDN
ncbi:MAG: 6-carboxytetrahydropterin synthase [Salinivirgaceae bacterium]